MAAERPDAFEVALAAVRDRLREGTFVPGSRIPASKLADDLQLSATPVREALSRVAGEGLVEERRQQGFFVRALAGEDVADLYRMSQSQLLMVHAPHRAQLADPASRRPGPAETDDPVRDLERLFAGWMREAGSGALVRAYRTLAIQLGPVRRAEPLVFDDLKAEARELLGLADAVGVADRVAAIRRFHARRIGLSDRLASLLNRPDRPPNL
jgi:DNA-binding transcriptional regulator YhcF (GntR family)